MKPGDKVTITDKECLEYQKVGVVEEPATDFFVSVRFKDSSGLQGFFVEQLELVVGR